MAFEATIDRLQAAVGHATSLWGGLYDPFLCEDAELARRRAAGLGVDVVWALDAAPVSTQLAALPGYGWRGRSRWGPLGPRPEIFGARLISPDFLFPDADLSGWVLPTWDSGDPLRHLFSVWFGTCGSTGGDGEQPRNRFVDIADRLHIGLGEAVPDVDNRVTPIKATALGINYRDMMVEAMLAAINPHDPTELAAFWNLRASGWNVFPWPVGQSIRVAEAARSWLQRAKDRGEFGAWCRANVWCPSTRTEIPTDLAALLDDMAVNPELFHSDFIDHWWIAVVCHDQLIMLDDYRIRLQ